MANRFTSFTDKIKAIWADIKVAYTNTQKATAPAIAKIKSIKDKIGAAIGSVSNWVSSKFKKKTSATTAIIPYPATAQAPATAAPPATLKPKKISISGVVEIAAAVAAPSAVAFIWPGYSSVAANGLSIPLIEGAFAAGVGYQTVRTVSALYSHVANHVFPRQPGQPPRELKPFGFKRWIFAGAVVLGVNAAASTRWQGVNPNDNFVHGLVTIGNLFVSPTSRVSPNGTGTSVVSNVVQAVTGDAPPDGPGPATVRYTQAGDYDPATREVPGVAIIGQHVCVTNILPYGKSEVLLDSGLVRMKIDTNALKADPGGNGCIVNAAPPPRVAPAANAQRPLIGAGQRTSAPRPQHQ